MAPPVVVAVALGVMSAPKKSITVAVAAPFAVAAEISPEMSHLLCDIVNLVYHTGIVHGVYYIANPVVDMKTREPIIGALLHAAWAAARKRISAGLMDAGFTDLLPAHLMVLQYPGADGEHPSTLARRAGMSKQAMNKLLGSLDQLGYIERVQDKRDGRARIVRVTGRGTLAMSTIRDILAEIEREWAVALGVARFADFKSTLEMLRQMSPDILD